MAYFDDKSEVLKLELTNHGKRLLSNGILKPAYYAFFDDDVIYDSLYGGLEELQNSTQDRILNETPILKPQANFTNIEKETLNFLTVDNNLYKFNSDLDDANKSTVMPIGLSSYNSEYFPAWEVSFYSGGIYNWTEYLVSDVMQPYIKIPQLNLKELNYFVKTTEDFMELNDNYELLGSLDINNKLQYIISRNEETVIDFQEKNVDDLKKNFEIEVFIEEKNDTSTYWRRLNFFKTQSNIKDGILLDNFEYDQNDSPDSDNVEYYIELKVDNEIENIYGYINKEINTVEGLYNTNITDGTFGEDC